jgi:SAM-dependent methyltransferase
VRARRLIRWVGHCITRLSELGRDPTTLDLSGDRLLEWSWVAAHLPGNPGRVLDLGCGEAFLGLTAALKGGVVIGLDRQAVHLPYSAENLQVQTADILDYEGTAFDSIINCSSIEHVGLPGRYGNSSVPDGDLIAMARLRELTRVPTGVMLLTIPVGQDAVFPPLHRVYGVRRLALLLAGFTVVEEEFWAKKPGDNVWRHVSKEEALSTKPSESFYSLGFFILQTEHTVVNNDG